MNRDELEERATDYAKGFKTGYKVAETEVETREEVAYEKGIRARCVGIRATAQTISPRLSTRAPRSLRAHGHAGAQFRG